MTKPWALITGANGGIGQALVRCFAENGYCVIATDKLEHNPFSDLADVHHIYLNLQGISQDSSYTEGFVKNVEEITSGAGITCLVNNAAVQNLGHCSEVSREDWGESFDVNLSAPFFLTQAFLDQLTSNTGSVVNISSIHATQTKQSFITYATTKAALSSLTRNLAVDLQNKVRVNAIEPAAIATEMLKAGFESTQDKFNQLENYHPIARIGEPTEVAELALFLCSEKANFVHGACISASGGIQGVLSDPDWSS